jgi:hypothetical protein
VEAERNSRPLRLRDFRVEVVAPGLTDRQLRSLEKSLSSGLVQAAICQANTLQVSVTGSHAEEVTP